MDTNVSTTTHEQNIISTEYFQIEDVNSDNACFFRAVSNGLCFRSSYLSADEVLKYTKTQYGNHKTPEDLFEHAEWGFSGDEQEKLSRKLQKAAYQWIKKNKQKIMKWDDDFSCSVSDLVELTHGIDIHDYLKSYSVFAADDLPDVDEIDDMIYGDRWGGFIEQIALSHIYSIPILVLSAHRYDMKRNKIVNGTIYRNKAYRDVYFKLYQVSGIEYLSDEKPPLFILWKKVNKQPHYMALYTKDISDLDRAVKDLINGK